MGLNSSALMAAGDDELALVQLQTSLDVAETRLLVAARDLSIAVRALETIIKTGGHPAIVAKQALDGMVSRPKEST